MIGRLSGSVVSEELDGSVVVDVAGVGYEVLMPIGASTRARAGSDAVVLFIHTHVREDSLDLFGFPTLGERDVFRLLISVPNIGPKTALAVLSELPPADLARAVTQGDLARLNKITGIGKKTAERLVLELKEKLPRIGPIAAGAPVAAQPLTGDRERLLGALTNMGYRTAEAERAVDALGARVGEIPLPAALKEALAFLAR